jgi:amino acid transporter
MPINLLIVGVVPWRQFVPPAGTPLADPPPPVVSWFIEKIYGRGVAKVFTVMVLWTAFASCFCLVLGYSRIPFAAARDGNFFAVFSRVHPRKEFPHVSLILVGAAAIVCSFLPLMTVIDALLTTRILVQFIGQIGAVWWLRRRQPKAERPFKMWLYPLPALVALVGWLFLFGTTDLTTLLYSLGVLAFGVVVFLGWSRWTRRWPFEAQVLGF